MAIDYTTLFTRLGAIIGRVNEYVALQSGGTISLMGSNTGVDKILDQYTDVTTSRRDLVVGLQETFDPGFTSQVQGWIDTLNGYAATLLADLQAELNTDSGDSVSILTALYWRMLEDEESIKACVTAEPTYAVPGGDDVNFGNGSVLAGYTNEVGVQDQRVIPEVVKAICTSDSYTDGVTAGAEVFQLTGYPSWPAASYKTRGNGTGPTLTVVDPDSATLNYLDNGNMETFTVANTPDSWTLVAGAAGTEIFKTNTNQYRGTNGLALRSAGGGSPAAITVSQALTTVLEPSTVYCLAVRVKTDYAGGDPTTSTVQLYADVDGVPSYAHNSTWHGLGTAWSIKHVFFCTPPDLGTNSTVVVKLTWTGANDAGLTGRNLYIDDVVVCDSVSFGFVHYAAIRGTADFARNDIIRITTANNYAGKFQTYLARYFQAMLPTDPSNTIDDALVV